MIPMSGKGMRTIVSDYIPDCGEHDEIAGFYVISHDITEQRQSERFLRDQRKQLRILTDAIPALVSYLGRDMRYKFVNAAYTHWFKMAPHEFVNMHMRDLVGEDLYQDRLPLLERAFAGEMIKFESPYAHPLTGVMHSVDVRYIPDKDNSGQVRGIVITVDDVTEFKEAVRRAEDAARARDEFISMASHELKTPLTSLRLQEQLIARRIRERGIESLDPQKLLDMLANSERQTERLTRLVDDMLEMSRIVHRKFTIRPQTANLKDVINDCLTRLQPQLDQADCRVECQLEEIIGEWDRYRIEQIFTNLMTNAMKYGIGRPIHIRLETNETSALLRVRDEGIGIAPESVERIFERFERAISNNEVSGLGMGLYISRELARAHKGEITVTSIPGQGAVFTVCLPLHAAANDAPE